MYNRPGPAAEADGIVISPSHNPPPDGGFKYNPPNGGPADTDVTDLVQKRANELLRENKRLHKAVQTADNAAIVEGIARKQGMVAEGETPFVLHGLN